MKRFLCLILALTLALGLASCGSEPTNDVSTGGEASASGDSAAEPSATASTEPTAETTADGGAVSGDSAADEPAVSPDDYEQNTFVAPTMAQPDVSNCVDIVLSDGGITVDGAAASTDPTDAVYVGADIVYYEDGTDETYGEGEEHEKHSADEAAAHTVVTITQAGAYRLSGSLSRGQVAIDLGEDAETDPSAVVTVLLDGADVTCTVAPALIFYNVYEPFEADAETAQEVVDTSAAGANVVIAAGSVNNFDGSHVARIYKPGTEKKLHKYDAAFYSKKTMNLFGEDGDDSGVLNITADNEGLDAEMHMTINGGTINISAYNDGINTNEDFVSVTTINGGVLNINAGLGEEGDGIDSNGWLVINGGSVTSAACERAPDGGIDADNPILVNGGSLYAFGTRNDAVSADSSAPYMELSFASTLAAGTLVEVYDGDTLIWSATTIKRAQALTLTCPELQFGGTYSVYVNGTLQCYASAGANAGMGMMGGGFNAGEMPEGMELPEGEPPEGMTPPSGESGDFDPTAGTDPNAGTERPEMQEGMTPPSGMPEDFDPNANGETTEGTDPNANGGFGGGRGGMGFGGFGGTGDGSGETAFVLIPNAMTFSGVCDSDASGKTRVAFTVEGVEYAGRGDGDSATPPSVPTATITEITAITASVEIDASLVQITVTDNPSEDYRETCLLADGIDAINDLLPEDAGSYTLTVAVVSESGEFTGATQIEFTVAEAEATAEE